MGMPDKRNQYSEVKRPTVQLSPEEHRKIFHYCIDHDIKIGDFLKKAAMYCLKNKIDPTKD